jgi:hypothetical protein
VTLLVTVIFLIVIGLCFYGMSLGSLGVVNMTRTMTDALGVYYIDRFNYPGLQDDARKGNPIAREVRGAILHFLQRKPETVCQMCDTRYSETTDVSFIVVLGADKRSLTTWVCIDCAARDDLDDHIAAAILEWLVKDGTNASVEIVDRGKITWH